MNARTLAALVLLNVVLLAAVIVTAFTPQSAHAQLGAAGDQYLLISGETPQPRQQAAVYVLNVNTGQIVSLVFNSANDEVQVIDRRNVTEDIERARQGQR